MQALKARLEYEASARNRENEVCMERPDPILVAQRHKEPYSALACALFAYGSATAIVKFLDSLDFSLFDADEASIEKALSQHYYRFQKSEDVVQFFMSMRRLKATASMEAVFMQGYAKEGSVVHGINALIEALRAVNPHRSHGYDFLIGSPVSKTRGASPLKRWLMFLRWMVREDAIDFGLWKGVSRSDLIIPLDTHTFNVSRKLGLLERKTYDLHAALELTETLKRFDPEDPVKYDFALYRIGQEKKL